MSRSFTPRGGVPSTPTTTLLRSRAVKKLLVLLVVAGIAFIAAKKIRATS